MRRDINRRESDLIFEMALIQKLRMSGVLTMAAALFWGGPGRLRADETITIDTAAPARPFPHFWEQASSAPAERSSPCARVISDDLRATKRITDFKYVRFHAIFHDEMGVYDEDAQGRPAYNFSYVDQVYDGLLENGVKPFVELSLCRASSQKSYAPSVLV